MKQTGQPKAGSIFDEIKRRAEIHRQELGGAKAVIMVGAATCGRAAGALKVLRAIKDELKKHNLDCPVLEVGCMGHCYAEPIVVISKTGYPPIVYQQVNPVIARRLVKEFILGDDPCLEFVLGALGENELVPDFADFPRARFEQKVILKDCGFIDPEDIEHYIAGGGYSALNKALQIAPEEVIAEVKKSGLRGRGGAGFPAGEKWELCRSAAGKPKYVICNGDEGDPGAFVDRAILESNPHSVIEGMLVAAYAVGAQQGYIYVRAEYPLAVKRVRLALRQAKKLGLLGKNILGSDFSFDIKLFEGSGAFVCGEESALIASLEGEAGTPSHRPPYPAESGLNGKPTLINNVKTLAYVRHIIGEGADKFAGAGTKKSPGTAVFALAGKVVNTGLAEVPMGTTLRRAIFDVGSGIPNGKGFKAVQIGGPSGGCLPESALDLPIDFDSLTGAGAMMGSGGMIVLDEDDCMVEIARYFLEFTQRESCGKCTFCRLGTKQMLEILSDITKGKGKLEDLDTLIELAEDVRAGSLCGLGRTAPNPILSTLRYFRDEYEAHILEGRCPALMCPELIAFYIIPDKCERSCDACV
ncbi:MAG TPA: NADH-ubiquinone oxidoreductase-F iron-sulfur binding region domain-containing protein, partial [Dehalococcoidales bacterium]|nr:NADH-ubiquinone oxidoreductase-F iron-sulfur binding region domain-containing protein [Dehalococcoidales bacterium]